MLFRSLLEACAFARRSAKYDDHISNIELPIILIPEVNLQDATKIFIDINANQRKVNRSIVYDLYANIDDKEYEYIKSINNYLYLTSREYSNMFSLSINFPELSGKDEKQTNK